VAVDVDASTIELIGETIRQGRCILFLGAGAHAPPPDDSRFVYPAAVRPPLGSALSKQLATSLGDRLGASLPNEDPRNLQRIALFFQVDRSRERLVDEIRKSVHEGKRPSPALRALAEMDFPLVITTNYDQLFEIALVLAAKQPRVSIYTPDLEATVDHKNPESMSPIVFKVHGDIDRPKTIVVTDEDYIQFLLRMGNKEPYDPIPLTVRYYLTAWPTLFVGYSLLDYNLRVLFKSLRWGVDPGSIKDMYSVDRAPDPLIFKVWHEQRGYVHFIVKDVWAFVPELYRIVMGKEIPDYDS
jgi:SIR2-like domain